MALTGYSADQFFGDKKISFKDLMSAEDQRKVAEKTHESISNEVPYDIVYKIVDMNEDEKWVRDRGKNFPGKDGEGEFLEGFISDITKEKSVDEMKTEFLSMAAHELRTPLASIYGFSELLHTRRELSGEVSARYINSIFTQSKQLANIVNDLLDISRIESAGGFSLRRLS